MSSASWRSSATTFGVTICLATSPLHRLTYHSLPQSTATATTGTYQVGAGMGPGLRGGWAISSICKGSGAALRSASLAPSVQRSLATSWSHLGLLVFSHLSSSGFCCHSGISLSSGPQSLEVALWFPSVVWSPCSPSTSPRVNLASKASYSSPLPATRFSLRLEVEKVAPCWLAIHSFLWHVALTLLALPV